VTNADDDVAEPAILTGAVSGNTTESGGEATFTVTLASEPTGDVYLNMYTTVSTEARVSVYSITFTAENWNVPQTVTVIGEDDSEVDGDQAYSVILQGGSISAAQEYWFLETSVAMINEDNDD